MPVVYRVVVVVCTVLTFSPTSHAQRPKGVQKHALLVGCSEYQNQPDLKPLKGAANDVRLWNELLTDPTGFAFPLANVTQLAGWPDNQDHRPTYANIVHGLKTLAEKASLDDQIVIVLSGHGTQFPILDRKNQFQQENFEADGLDQIFLPADVLMRTHKEEAKNFLGHQEIVAWLNKIRQKGAHVFSVFDCCCSGNMAHDVNESTRSVNPLTLGFTEKQIKDSVASAREEVKKAKQKGWTLKRAKVKSHDYQGSLVAFYAARSFEDAIELKLPLEMEFEKRKRHGLLNFTLVQALQQRKASITYEELHQILVAKYKAIPLGWKPEPYAEGDLAREVLGIAHASWPLSGRTILLQREDGLLRINAGQLYGITPGSILAVHSPAGIPNNEVQGYLQVTSSSFDRADVVVCGFNGKPAVTATALSDRSRCELVAKNYGDMRVKLFLGEKRIKDVFGTLDKEIQSMIHIVESESDATWMVKSVDPKTIVLAHAARTQKNASYLTAAGTPVVQHEFRRYTMEQLKSGLELDLPKLLKWQNVWRVAGEIVSERGRNSVGLTLEMAPLKDETESAVGQPPQTFLISKETRFEFRVKNDGKQKLWVTAFYLSVDREIVQCETISVEADKTEKLQMKPVAVRPGFAGREGIAVFAFPYNRFPNAPDLTFLEQSGLGQESIKRGNLPKKAQNSPFESWMRQVTLIGDTRNGPSTPLAQLGPMVAVRSWFVVP